MADKKVRRLFLCRHGKTEANEKGIYCGGGSDSPLNKKGKKQGELLGKALKKYYKFQGNLIISSDRSRAIETAQIISRNFEPSPFLLTLRGLREIDIGEWCGKTAAEIRRIFPEEHEKWQKGHLGPDFRFRGGESMKEVAARAKKYFELVKAVWLDNFKYAKDDLIVIAHGGINMMILSNVMSAEMKTHAYRIFRQDNTCVNIISFRKNNNWLPEMQITLINSTHHLDMDFKKI